MYFGVPSLKPETSHESGLLDWCYFDFTIQIWSLQHGGKLWTLRFKSGFSFESVESKNFQSQENQSSVDGSGAGFFVGFGILYERLRLLETRRP